MSCLYKKIRSHVFAEKSKELKKKMLRTLSNRLLSKHYRNAIIQRSLSHYPIDETIFGLNEDQIKVRNKFEQK